MFLVVFDLSVASRLQFRAEAINRLVDKPP